MSKFHIKNLSYQSILKNINLDIKENQVNYISGSNKCGKTTLIRILCGLIEVKDTIYYDSHDLYDFNSHQLSNIFGRVLYQNNFTPTFPTINQELLYRLDQLNLKKEDRKKRYNDVVKLLELNEYLYQNIDDLSTVNNIKLLIALELLKKPEVLFLDDVFLDLDLFSAKEILLKLKTLKNLTIIISSTNLDLAVESDYITILNHGEVILDDDALIILKEDSLLNKIGLELPFMVDLSIKLKYYNLLTDIELDMNRMVEELWK